MPFDILTSHKDNMKSWSWMILVALMCAQMCKAVDSSAEDDKILSLPGQPQVSFQQYAGYITIDENQQRALFYYFVEAESDPASKPLVLWLNGGPGCSSIGAGAFAEHGPFRPGGRGSLVRNDYSWNKEANMLYVESPAGVGFSYSANTSFYHSVNDSITAQDNLKFLQQWFIKFPDYRNRDFYITGESYAGHYVPQLAHLIIQSGLSLKGVAIGNPLLDFDTDFNSEGDFYWSHGLISDATYQLQKSECNTSQIWRENITGSYSAACLDVLNHFAAEVPDEIDGYDVIADVCLSNGASQMDWKYHPLLPSFGFLSPVQKVQMALYNDQPKGKEGIDVCVFEKTSEYLNRKDVQVALHAKLVGVSNWTSCSRVMHYETKNLEIPTIGVVGSLVNSGIPVFVYSGDQDSVIPFTGTRTLVNGLAKQLGLNSTVPYRGWYDQDKQVGGWTQVYGNNILTYATIRGASHLAPFSSPKRSLALFTAFVAGKPLE